MKKFTKFLLVILIFALAFVVVGCKKNKPVDPDPDPTPVDDTPKALKDAIDYVYALYKDKDATTPSDWAVVAKSTGLDVQWTVTVTKGQTSDVVLTLNEAGTQYTVDVNDKSETEIEYTLKATITVEGKTLSKEFSFKVPAFRELTYAEYIAAAKGATVTIKGVVTAVIGKANGNSYNCLYLQDADGGYYAYGLTEDPSAAGDNQVKAGMTVRVTGVKDIYSGTIEVKEGAYEILDSTIKTVAVADYTAAYTAAKSLKDEALVGKQSILVKIDGVTISPEDDDIASGYYKFSIGALESYSRISSSVCPLNATQQAAFKENHKAGYTATVTGVVCVYDGAFYLTPVDDNAWSNLQLPTLSDADAVAAEKALLTAPVAAVTEDGDVALPTKGAAYADQVAITWASDKECAVVAADSSKVTFTLPEEETTVTLTATLKAGDATDTVTFEVKVDAAETTQYIAKKVTTMAAGTYKIAMDQTGAEGGKFLYADGELNSKGALTATDKLGKAADFVVAAVEGKENTYTIKVGDKYLVAYRNGNYNNMKLDDNAGEWVFDATLGVLTATINYEKDGAATTAVVYFGSYENKGNIGNTFALSETKYISGDNASKIGVSQFPGYLYTLQEAELVAKKVTAMAAGTYKIAMDQTGATGGQFLYADGELNSKGALTATDKLGKAADFVVAAVEGKENTYTIKVGDKYLVAYRNGNYNNMKLDDNAGEWVFDATLGVLTATINYEKDGAATTAVVYFGSYENKGNIGNTFALSETKYISGDNASKIGVSQFPGYLYTTELKPVGGEEEVEYPIVESTEVLVVSAEAAELEAGAYVTFEKARYIVGTNAFATLEAALAAAQANQTIKVAAGTYAGATIATEGITILGPNAGQSPVLGPRSEEAIFNSKITVTASKVTFDGIQLTGKGQIYADTAISELTLQNIYIYGSSVNDGNINNTTQLHLINVTDLVIKDSMIADDGESAARPMILYGYNLTNLTITGCSFTGRRTGLFNDGIKIDNAGDFGVKGNVTICDNVFTDYEQYVIWLRKYGAGTYNINNNEFNNIGTTAASHGMVTMVAYTGTAEDTLVLNMNYNKMDNSMILLRIDAATLPTTAALKAQYNVVTEHKGDFFVKNENASNVVDASYGYWNGGDPSAKMKNATYANAYTDFTEVPAIGDADETNNTFTIKFDLNGGEWFEENEVTYVYGHGFEAATPEKAGFTFVAWEDANGQLYTSFPASLKKNLELKAVWKAN